MPNKTVQGGVVEIDGDGDDGYSEDEEVTRELYKRCIGAGQRVAVASVVHPFLYSKTLIQLGHEPVPMTVAPRFILFGRREYFLPNGLSYVRHMYSRVGLTGLYTAVAANVTHTTVATLGAVATKMYLDRNWPDLGGAGKDLLEDIEPAHLSNRQALRKMLRLAIRESVDKTVGAIIARPFHVVMVRQMAQFIGGEREYVWLLPSLLKIYRDEGLGGLFAGLVPSLLAELGIVWTVHTTLYVVERTYVNFIPGDDVNVADDEVNAVGSSKRIVATIVPMWVNSLFYPLQLVATNLAVNACGLQAGNQPYAPAFGSWQDCYQYLTDVRGIKRGAGMFYRVHKGSVQHSHAGPLAIYRK